MYKFKLRRGLVLTSILVMLSTSVAAKEIDQLDWTGDREQWGRLLFCQHIYKLPEVSPRLYSFDIEQCDKAGLLMAEVVNKYPKQEQVDLKNQAGQHAALLFRNTSEPYHSVPACRAFCQELAEKQDTPNDR